MIKFFTLVFLFGLLTQNEFCAAAAAEPQKNRPITRSVSRKDFPRLFESYYQAENYREARRLCVRAVESEDKKVSARAQFHLAGMIYEGKGGEKDFPEARRLLNLVAESGTEEISAAAQFNLAVMIYTEERDESKLPEARRLFKIAAKVGIKKYL